jgi:hypothetical protein
LIYLYAVIDKPSIPALATSGLDGAVVKTLPYRGIGAVVSTLTTAEPSPTEANLWQHEAVLEELMSDHSVLPARFGEVFANATAVRAALKTRYVGFTTDLERVRGCVELGLRVLWDDVPASMPDCKPAASSDSGRDYMMSRLEDEREFQLRRQQAEAFAANIHAPLARLADDSTCRLLVAPSPYLTAAYLVKREDVAAFRQGVRSLGSTYPELRLLCTGPWPPFSFVREKPAEDREETRSGAYNK